MAFIKKNNTYIFIGIVAIMCCVGAATWGSLSLIRKLTTAFAVFAALHEIEEKVWPGGFYELMLKKFGIKKEEVDLGRATLVVSIYWLILLGSAYFFDSYAFLLAVTITLGFFEAFIHTAGIWIHHLKNTVHTRTRNCVVPCRCFHLRRSGVERSWACIEKRLSARRRPLAAVFHLHGRHYHQRFWQNIAGNHRDS